MIHSLSLENFRKHKQLKADFTSGMNGIFGPNYAGKTTILYGILFCLGGIKAVPCKNVVKTGCSTFSAEMEFSIEGVRYRVARTKSTDRLFRGDEQIANGASVVNKEIEKLIGMTMKRFAQIRYSRQKFTTSLLTLGATELHNILSDVSGADFVQKVMERLADMRKSLTAKTEDKELVDLTLLEAELEKASSQVDQLTTAKESHQEEMNKLTLGLQEARLNLQQAREGCRHYEDYITKKAFLESQVEKFAGQLAVLGEEAKGNRYGEEGSPTQESLDQMEARRQQLRSEILNTEAVAKQIAKAEERLKYANEMLAAAEAALAKAAETPTIEIPHEWMGDSIGLDRSVSSTKGMLLDVTSEIRSLSSLLSTRVCPTCGHEKEHDWGGDEKRLEELKKQEAEMREVIALDEKALLEVNEKISAVNKTNAKIVDDLTRAQRDHQMAVESAKVAAAAFEEIPVAPVDLESIKKELESLTDQIQSDSGYLRDLKNFNRRLSDTKSEHGMYVGRLHDLKEPVKVSREDLAVLEGEEGKMQSSYTVVSNELSAFSADLATAKAAARALELRLDGAKSDNKTLGSLLSKLAAVKALHKFLSESKDDYMKEIWSSLMADASQLVSQATAGHLESVERTDDGQFSYVEDGNSYASSEASGAQQAIMGLAVQTALARVLPPVLDVLLVDEPSADMDDEHSMTMSMLLPSRASQVICVSHARMDSATCSNVIDLGA